MPLTNFGSVLNFAEELEKLDTDFYRSALANPECDPYREVFQQFILDGEKNRKAIQRARRENVTEMILEGISDFNRAPFLVELGFPEGMKAAELLSAAQVLEERAERYYREAATKLKALSDVARELKLLGRKRTVHRERLMSL
jgi:rubrerythrin